MRSSIGEIEKNSKIELTQQILNYQLEAGIVAGRTGAYVTIRAANPDGHDAEVRLAMEYEQAWALKCYFERVHDEIRNNLDKGNKT